MTPPGPGRKVHHRLTPGSPLSPYHARMTGSGGKPIPEVLFVCTHNAGRSQMAAGFLRNLAGEQVSVRSAGSMPADRVNPAVVEVMAERGINLSGNIPNKLDSSRPAAADVVVTMGCGGACPVFPGKRCLDWDLDDPAGKGAGEVRPVRDEIEKRVREPDRRPGHRSPDRSAVKI